MIANARKALIDIEAEWESQTPEGTIHSVCLFTLDAENKANLKGRSIMTRATLTYSSCVGLVFGVF